MKRLYWYILLGLLSSSSYAQITINLEDGDTLTGVKDIHITAVTDKTIKQVTLRHQHIFTENGGGEFPDYTYLEPQQENILALNTAELRNGQHLYIACAHLENELNEKSAECDWAYVITDNVDTFAPKLRQIQPSPLVRPGTYASGLYTIKVSTWDESGVDLVRFYRDDGVLLATLTEPTTESTSTFEQYAFDWDTTSVDNGFHHLYAEAVDGNGNLASTKDGTLFLVNSFVPVPPILVENRYTPTNLNARAKSYHVNVIWEGSDQEERYVVYRRLSTETDFNRVAEIDNPIYVDDMPTTAEYVEYYVTALYTLGESEPTEVIRVYPTFRRR